MKQLIIFLLLLSLSFLSLFSLNSCEKYDNIKEASTVSLPAYSETGAGTFGFMLNNDVWTVFGKYHSSSELGGSWNQNYFTMYSNYYNSYIAGSGRMSIVQNNVPILDISADFDFVPTQPYIKTYFLKGDSAGSFSIENFINYKYYKLDSLKPLTLQLNKFEKGDSSYTICSGRFFGVVYNDQDATDSIIITDGRFDGKL